MIVGIDPGRQGGIALLYGFGTKVELEPMPHITAFADLMESVRMEGMHVFVERAQSFPKGGVSGMFNYGRHFGELLGVLVAMKIPHTLVPPAVWSRVMHAGTSGTDTKARSVEAALRLFPGVSLVPEGSKAKRAHLGMTEALLVCEYGRRQLAKV